MSVTCESVAVRGIDHDLERHRVALTRHCARMLRSPADAEDAVQETLLRAWRCQGGFERRSGLYSWLYRIATNVCLDMLKDRSRRPVPIDPAPLASAPLEATAEVDPAERALTSEAFRLALGAALERLPARQRAVLLLREVLCWRATEVAELLGMTTVAVNSSLQRARATLESTTSADAPPAVIQDSHQQLLASYLAAVPAG
jgi:RNA polymerase sigma-70 factor (ECF subfamily)